MVDGNEIFGWTKNSFEMGIDLGDTGYDKPSRPWEHDMGTMTVKFSDSLPILVHAIAEELGQDALRSGAALRDAMGRLSFFAGTDSILQRFDGFRDDCVKS